MRLPSPDLDHILVHTPGLWEELRGQRVFITGGTGFFGTWLLESFAHANEQLGLRATLLVLSRDPRRFVENFPHLGQRAGVGFIRGDVRDFAFPPEACSHVIHAGTTSGSPVPSGEMFDTIVTGTRRALAFAAACAARRFLFVSSGAVYGRQPPELTHVPEDYPGGPDPLDPASAYGEGKRAAELLCVLASRKHGFDAAIARCFAFAGPHLPLDAHFAVGNFLRDALAGGPIRVGGDGTPHRSYLYAADLAVWLWTILLRGTAGRAYNVGSDDGMTIAQVAGTVRTALGVSAPVRIARPPPPAGTAASRYVPDVGRAGRELGLRPVIDLATAVRRTAAWHGFQGGNGPAAAEKALVPGERRS